MVRNKGRIQPFSFGMKGFGIALSCAALVLVAGCGNLDKNEPRTVATSKAGMQWSKVRNTSKMEYSSAETYCQNLEQEGFDDWRVPSYLDVSKFNEDHRREYAAVFTKDQSYWTSDPGSEAKTRRTVRFVVTRRRPSSPEEVTFGSGKAPDYSKLLVTCVRGG